MPGRIELTIAMKNLLNHLVFVCALLLGAGCASSPYYDVRWSPAPLEVQVSSAGDPGSQVRALVSVINVRKAAEDQPARVELRILLDNLGSVPAQLANEGYSLVSAELVSFGMPLVAPEGGLSVAAGSQGALDLSFPFPDGKKPSQIDWSGLNLRFAVLFPVNKVTTGATFSREHFRPAYDTGPNFNIGFGVYHWDN
jgi:hypothetical protein